MAHISMLAGMTFSDFSKCYLLMSKDASHVVVYLQRLKMRYLSPHLLMFLRENRNGRFTIIITGCDVCVCSYSKILTHFKPDFNTVNSETFA